MQKAEWVIGKRSQVIDYVAWNPDKTVMLIVERKTDPVNSDHVGQTLGYRNLVQHSKVKTGFVKYRESRRATTERQLALSKVNVIKGILVGARFENSAVFAALGTDLELVRADRDWKRVLASAKNCIARPDEEQWKHFVDWQGPERREF